MRRRREAGEALLSEILSDRSRDRFPAGRPVVSVREQEEASFLAAVEARRVSGVKLSRRGTWHGEWAEIEPPERGRRGHGLPELAARWHHARPIVVPEAASAEELGSFADRIEDAAELHLALQEPRGLRAWLGVLAPELAPDFVARTGNVRLFDADRDIERILFASMPPSGPGKPASGKPGSGKHGRKVDDLWVKSSWLSDAENDSSLRVRVAFGRERDDDASGDLLRHRLVAELASRLFPECALVSANPALVQIVERMIGEPALFTQHIAYWNAPEGGALFHHDAFAEDEEESGRPGQLGVCYLQLSGRTAWLALSIEDLAVRVREFVECLAEGELPWVSAQLFPNEALRKRIEALVQVDDELVRELGLPGCGRFAALVNRGPEFTAWLADAGHAAVLSPGDAILLPNHGLARTAMHSVFCASEDTGYALSLAIRADRERAPFHVEETRAAPARRTRP